MARNNLLLLVILTAINCLMTAFDIGYYLLFSASLPYFVAQTISALVYYPEEMGVEPMENPLAMLVAAVVIALILTVPYLLCWIFSKKHYGWMIAALVLFSIDTLVLLVAFLDISFILDILAHVWVMYYLIMGVKNGKNAVQTAAEGADGDPLTVDDFTVRTDIPEDGTATEAPTQTNTPALRSAAEAEGRKIKVYASTFYGAHQIEYRCVEKTEELVVDGMVYAELPKGTRPCHMKAVVDGLTVEAGVLKSASVIMVDGNVMASVTRWL